MSWDIAFSEQEKGDYSACVVLLRRREVFFVLEVIRERLRFDDLRRKILEVKRRPDIRPSCPVLGGNTGRIEHRHRRTD